MKSVLILEKPPADAGGGLLNFSFCRGAVRAPQPAHLKWESSPFFKDLRCRTRVPGPVAASELLYRVGRVFQGSGKRQTPPLQGRKPASPPPRAAQYIRATDRSSLGGPRPVF